ncbi:trehalose 6-phosphate phosphatase [Jannaschia pagri]|uniref:Trehalose 6-phosphate phosphatase n=1 Tax=Jannaschia pagri TaxID=2829797 RepID=A0ABQ4NI83_9RHOB|nr:MULTISPECIES: trehalose-phosphatase [unclassified Jannaschia]GIT89780.1 trehalose 6-phosphate phosphatase [Jannaschia sp. AI_61]GIT94112.1 trehalose 6-phosphate phosphatase [Jannaschia sp. AI_62]
MLYYQMMGFMEGDRPRADYDLPLPPPDTASLFLDFDGTLVDIADRPDGVVVPPLVPAFLEMAQKRLAGRVAIVSGRSVAQLEAFLPDFDGPLIGSHGAERRIAGETTQAREFDADRIDVLQRMVTDFASLHPAFLVETKPTGVVLHYRQAQEQGALALRFMDSIAAAADGFRLQPALCAYEIKPDSVGKDIALADLFDTAPFAGTTPVYAGDDLTDEPALAWAADQGGAAIKVGEADTVAAHRLPSPQALLDRLGAWLA